MSLWINASIKIATIAKKNITELEGYVFFLQ